MGSGWVGDVVGVGGVMVHWDGWVWGGAVQWVSLTPPHPPIAFNVTYSC